MFEKGREYQIRITEDDGECLWQGEVVEWQPPLLKVIRFNKEEVIINTNSFLFHSAEIQPFRTAEQKSAALKQWENLAKDLS